MSDPRQIYTQASNPNPYAPQPHSLNSYAGSPPSQSPPNTYQSPPPQFPHSQGSYPNPYSEPAPAQPPHQYQPEKQHSMSYQQPQQPQASYQQQPGPHVMSPPMSPPIGSNEKGPHPGYNGSQPAPQQGMAYSAAPLNNGKQVDHNGERDWNNSFFDCFGDCGTCCLSFFCPCMVYQQVKTRVEHLQRTGRPDPEHGGSGCGGDCFLHGALTGCCGLGWVFQMGSRASIRSRYRIRGGGCTDCLAAAFCTPCELTQESRELDIEEKSQLQYP